MGTQMKKHQKNGGKTAVSERTMKTKERGKRNGANILIRS